METHDNTHPKTKTPPLRPATKIALTLWAVVMLLAVPATLVYRNAHVPDDDAIRKWLQTPGILPSGAMLTSFEKIVDTFSSDSATLSITMALALAEPRYVFVGTQDYITKELKGHRAIIAELEKIKKSPSAQSLSEITGFTPDKDVGLMYIIQQEFAQGNAHATAKIVANRGAGKGVWLLQLKDLELQTQGRGFKNTMTWHEAETEAKASSLHLLCTNRPEQAAEIKRRVDESVRFWTVLSKPSILKHSYPAITFIRPETFLYGTASDSRAGYYDVIVKILRPLDNTSSVEAIMVSKTTGQTRLFSLTFLVASYGRPTQLRLVSIGAAVGSPSPKSGYLFSSPEVDILLDWDIGSTTSSEHFSRVEMGKGYFSFELCDTN